MSKRIFTRFLISQNIAVLSWLVMLVGLIDIEHMQSVIKVVRFFFFFFFFFVLFCFVSVLFCFVFFFKNCYYFSHLEIQWPRNPELKSSSPDLAWNFMAPMGPLKIKTGLPTSPICQRALITHGQLITKYQLKSLIGQFKRKGCQSVIIVYWHNCLKAISNRTTKIIGK